MDCENDSISCPRKLEVSDLAIKICGQLESMGFNDDAVGILMETFNVRMEGFPYAFQEIAFRLHEDITSYEYKDAVIVWSGENLLLLIEIIVLNSSDEFVGEVVLKFYF